MIDISVLRDSFKMLPQVAASSATNTPDLRSIFTPSSHAGALDPTREIVVGDRGVGKSFWSSVLQDNAARTAVSAAYPGLKLKEMEVSLGFSETLAGTSHPSSRILAALLRHGIGGEVVWRAVFFNGVNPHLGNYALDKQAVKSDNLGTKASLLCPLTSPIPFSMTKTPPGRTSKPFVGPPARFALIAA